MSILQTYKYKIFYKQIPLKKGISKLEQNKIMHDAGINLLDEKLEEIFNVKNARENYCSSLNGKPYLKNSSINFNISHCNNIVVVIISNKNVGIDIEDIKEFKKSIIRKVLTNNELIDLLSANNKKEYFFKLWTLKESFLKAIGTGLSYGMQNIEFSIKDKNIICNKIGFLFKQESLIFNNNKYIVSITWEV